MKRIVSFFVAFLLCLTVFTASADESSNNAYCGKWSFYWDNSDLPIALKNVLDYNVLSYELYIFDDGSAYMTKLSIDKNGKPDFSRGALSGIWLSDGNAFTIRVDTNTFKAFIEDDIMKLYMTEKIYFPFVHIDQSDLMYDQLVY